MTATTNMKDEKIPLTVDDTRIRIAMVMVGDNDDGSVDDDRVQRWAG
jgi:hypothetical protein